MPWEQRVYSELKPHTWKSCWEKGWGEDRIRGQWGGGENRHWEWERGLQSGKDYLLVLEW